MAHVYNLHQKDASLDSALNQLYEYVSGDDADNIARILDDDQIAAIGTRVVQDFDIDETSRWEWEKSAKEAMDLALQVTAEKNWPFHKASNIKYPLITVAALQFNARAYPAVVDSEQIVKVRVIGNDDGVPQMDQNGQPVQQQGPDGQPVPAWVEGKEPQAKKSRGDRVAEHMSYQLMEKMTEWEEDTDTLLVQLPIVGTAFRKIYYDEGEGRPISEMVAALDLVVNQNTKAMKTAPRVTQKFKLYPHEIEERIRDGRFVEDFDPGTAEGEGSDEDAPHEFLEQHRYWDLDGDGLQEPYICTVHKDSDALVRVVANFGIEDIKHNDEKILRITKRNYFVKYGFIRDPSGGFYDIGFGSLLESLSAAIDTAINQMLDAGTLQNAGGGFIGAGVRLKKSQIRIEPGVYKTVDATGATLKDAIYHHTHPGPSDVLFNLLGMMIEAAKDITGVKDIFTGDSGGKVQTATTTLALIEQGMKQFTAIYKRVYRSLKEEFKLLAGINAETLDEQEYFHVLDEQKQVSRADYDLSDYDICPQADPRIVTDMQRMARAEFLLSFKGDPTIDQIEINRRVLTAAGQEDVEKLMAPPPQPDPIEQEMRVQTLDGEKTGNDKMRSEIELNEAKVADIKSEIEETEADMHLKGRQQAQKEEDADRKHTLAAAKLVADVEKYNKENMAKIMTLLQKQGDTLESQEKQRKTPKKFFFDDQERIAGYRQGGETTNVRYDKNDRPVSVE